MRIFLVKVVNHSIEFVKMLIYCVKLDHVLYLINYGNFRVLLYIRCHSGTVAPDDEEEEDLSDIEEGDDADATSAKQLSKKQQVNRPVLLLCDYGVQACLMYNYWNMIILEM